MLKRKLAAVLAGSAVLAAMAVTPIAYAQSEGRVYDPATGTWQQAPSPVPDSPRRMSSRDDSPVRGDSPVREYGRVNRPTPYGDVPSSGHMGDQYYYKQFGGVSPP